MIHTPELKKNISLTRIISPLVGIERQRAVSRNCIQEKQWFFPISLYITISVVQHESLYIF